MSGFHLISDNVRRGENQIVQRSTFRHTRAEQVLQGLQVRGFTITGAQPERIHGVLCWACTCPAGHTIDATHSALENECPTCPQCVAATITKATGHGESSEQYQAWAREHRKPRSKKGQNEIG